MYSYIKVIVTYIIYIEMYLMDMHAHENTFTHIPTRKAPDMYSLVHISIYTHVSMAACVGTY